MSPVVPLPSPPHPTLFLVDGYALIYRAFFALLSRPLRTAKGENTSAAWGVVSFLQRLIDKHQPEYLAWIHDAGTSFRHEVYPAYKATREKLTQELQADFDQGVERIEELLNAFRVPIIAINGYEADDVIGTLCQRAADLSLNVVIVSGDKDFQQLVRPGVWLLNPGRGGPASVEEQWVSVENGSERLGVPPALVTDYLALLGDSSDNVPGVPGVGEKTAQELIATYGNLDQILARAAEVTKKRPREALLAFGAQARLSRELVTIRYDVPVTLDLPKLKRQAPDVSRLQQLYRELEFSSLLKGLEAAGMATAAVSTTPPAKRHVVLLQDVEALNALVSRIQDRSECTLVIERVPTGGDVLRSRIAGIAFALDPQDTYYLPLEHRAWLPAQGALLLGSSAIGRIGPEGSNLAAHAIGKGLGADAVNLPPLCDPTMSRLRAMLEDSRVRKVGHNLKQAELLFRNHGIRLGGIHFDTMVASYVLDPGKRDHSLAGQALEFLEHTLPSHETLRGKGKQELGFDMVPARVAAAFTAEYADIAAQLHQRLAAQLDAMGMTFLYSSIEVPLITVLADMEWVGVAIDTAWFHSLKARFQKERERVEEEIYEAASGRFNINSNPQLRVVLFEKLGLPVKKRTPSGPSTDVTVLQELAEEGHQLPTLLMEYRELAKLESTYLDTLPQLVLPRDNRLHTSYNQTVAATGRLSSSDPNLQNIPIRRELGRDIRRGFIPAPGQRLIAADYSQIELRLLAHLSRDEAFVQAFSTGEDIHRQTAAIIFSVPIATVTSEMRARAKTINFATIYGQGAHALSRQLKISSSEAKEFIDTYFLRFRGVRDYLDSMIAFARDRGYVETIFQRRRYIPELKERNFNLRAFGERVATNAPIQGSAADLIKIAMIRIHDRLLQEKSDSRMILQVHDELVFEAPLDEVVAVSAIVKEEMEGAARLSVPLVVDIGIGDNWVEAKR